MSLTKERRHRQPLNLRCGINTHVPIIPRRLCRGVVDLKSVVYKEGDHYISQCLDVDVSSFGKTKKEALAMLTDALSLYFEDMPLPNKTERIKNASIASIELQHA